MARASTSIGEEGGDDAGLADAAEPLSFDETVRAALAFCESLPPDFAPCGHLLEELQTRLSRGRLHFAVLGQFNRGKSTFINALLRIKALPTSVLPLTSVPTLIEYGTETLCRVRFLDGRDDAVVTGASGEIESALRRYVAEASNPKNRLGVRDVTLTCAGDLLANGTVLIDTPGFGSTHLHNTQTTLDLLPECDAALFLLSADPPMTQTEMEFLRQVKERIPKVYFILNKVDLLSAPELDEVEGFIRNILCKELGFPIDTVLYRTCALQGERARAGKDGDKAWEQSGLCAVRKEVLDFMVREKYFTLSEALSGKYSEIMADIKARLEKRLADINAPITAAQQEVNAAADAIQSLNLELESQLKRCAEERKALTARFDALTKESGERCAASIKKTLHEMLDGKYFPDEAASIAAAMLPKHAADLGARLLDAMIESANKSVRSLALHHALAVTNLQKRHAELLKGRGTAEEVAEKFTERVAITAANRAPLFDAAPWETPQPHLTDIFKNRATRLEAIRAFYEPRCVECAAANINQAAKQAHSLCDAAWGRLQGEIRASYQGMIDHLNPVLMAKKELLRKAQEGAKGDIALFKDKIRELGALL
jgi:ribosome biogenesis GTPase A